MNRTDLDEEYYEQYLQYLKVMGGLGWQRVSAVYIAIIAIIGFIGNGLILICVATYSKMQSKSYMLVANLAVSDICNSALAMSTYAFNQWVGWWNPFVHNWICEISGYVMNALPYISVHSLLMIAVNRATVVFAPHWYNRHFSTTLVVIFIAYSWIAGLVCLVWGLASQAVTSRVTPFQAWCVMHAGPAGDAAFLPWVEVDCIWNTWIPLPLGLAIYIAIFIKLQLSSRVAMKNYGGKFRFLLVRRQNQIDTTQQNYSPNNANVPAVVNEGEADANTN